MAKSLIDFGTMMQAAIGLGQLDVAQERNRLTANAQALDAQQFERRADIQEENNRLEEKRIKQNSAFRGFDELQKLRDHPSLAMNRGKQVDLVMAQGALLEQALGIKVPLPSREEMAGGYEAVDRFVKTIRSGKPEEKLAAATDMFAANPTFAKMALEDMKKAGEVSVQMEELSMKMQLHGAQLQALNLKNARANLQQNFYTEHVAGLSRSVQLASDPKYKDVLTKVMNFEKPEARQIFLNMNPEFRDTFEADVKRQVEPVTANLQAIQEEIQARRDAIEDVRARTGEAPQEQVEELMGLEAVANARQAQVDYLSNPYDREKWRGLRKAEQDLKILQGKAGKQISEIADQRTALMREKFDQKTQSGLAESSLQEQYINNLNSGMDDNQALGAAIKKVKQTYPGVPFDSTKILNPAKKGRLDVGIKMGQAEVDRNLKQIDSAQSVIDLVGDLADTIRANPSVVGKGAQVARAFAGAGQQLRALVGLDPGAAKFLNTKVRDDAEAMQEILVYLQAKSMDPSGALDIKVVQHARDVVGDLSGWTTGPQQILNKLDFVRNNADRNMRRARKNLKGGVPGMLEDSRPAKKPVSDMSLEETLSELLSGAQ